MTPFIRCFALLLALAVAPSLFAADEPLEPEQAYRFSVQALDAHSIEARWQIENGYYMFGLIIAGPAFNASVSASPLVSRTTEHFLDFKIRIKSV